MKIMKWIVIGIVVLIVGSVVVGFVLPSSGHVERSITINAKPATVYTVLNGFRQFDKWSPWRDLDPSAKTTIEGPLMGVGAKQSWASEDPKVGTGGQEILEVRPFEYIKIKLWFGGYDAPSFATYSIAADGTGTKLTWSYDSDFGSNLMYHYFGLMLDGKRPAVETWRIWYEDDPADSLVNSGTNPDNVNPFDNKRVWEVVRWRRLPTGTDSDSVFVESVLPPG